MASFLLSEPMDPLWTLFSRRFFSRLAYWLATLGFNARDRSLSNRIYLIYFIAFWSIWALLVFSMLGAGLSGLLTNARTLVSPPQLVVDLSGLFMAAWAWVLAWQVARRSPFVFSEQDAYLLCRTPVSPRKVGLLWFLQGSLEALVPFAAGAIILAFTLVQWRLPDQSAVTVIPAYLRAALLALTLILPLQVGWQAALWGLGAWRLREAKGLPWLRPLLVGLVALFLAGLFIPEWQNLLSAPFHVSLSAAFILEPPLVGLAISLLSLAAGLAFLFIRVGKLHLSRAAQETSHLAALRTARSYGQTDLVNSMLLRRRLGMARLPSRLLAGFGSQVLFWKDLLQSLRAWSLRDLLSLASVFALSLGMFQPSGLALQMLMAGIWTILIGGLATSRLRSDLAHWWLLRSLPFRPSELLLYELALACGVQTLLGWAALALLQPPLPFGLYAAMLLPLLAANGGLSAAQDILSHSVARLLMSPSLAEENVPRQDLSGMLRGLISVLIPFGLLLLFSVYTQEPFLAALALPVALLITWLNIRALLAAYRWIQ